MLLTENGFTLIEIMVTLGLFLGVLVIASNAFNKIVSQATTYSKMEESNIEGVIGLEVMRHDLAQMGFGLPWGFSKSNAVELVDSTIQYSEATDTIAAALNEPANGVPRALVGYAAFGNFSSAAYIGVKATSVGSSKVSQRWTYIPFHNYSATPYQSRPVSFMSNNPHPGDKVIFVNSNVNDAANKDHRLIVSPTDPTNFSYGYSATTIDSSFLPLSDENSYTVYGVDDSGVTLHMPFNRADFFIGTSASGVVPPFCSPRTGVLYKATVSQSNGGYSYVPLLDCVADMQIVLGWDISDGGMLGAVNVNSSLPQKSDGQVINVATEGTNASIDITAAKASITGWMTDPKGIREHLKVVKVYILAQEGKVDTKYSTPATTITVGDMSNGFKKDYTLSAAQQHYRWKLYRIVVRPRNLVSNSH